MIDTIQSLDASALLFIQDHLRAPILNTIMVLFTKLGDLGFIWIITGLFLLIWVKTRRGAIFVLICLLAAYLINDWGFKLLVERPRPYATIEGLSILVKPLSSFSFPSGHSSSSFAAAIALTLAFGKRGALAYIPAFIIAFSRCYVGVHYPSDIIGGALVGTLVSFVVYTLLNRYLKADFIPNK